MDTPENKEDTGTITYSLTVDDIAVWQEHIARHTPMRYWLWARYVVIAACVPVCLFLIHLATAPTIGRSLAYPEVSYTLSSRIGMIVMIVGTFAVTLAAQYVQAEYQTYRAARRLHDSGTYEGTLSPATVALRNDSIQFLNRKETDSIPWRAAHKIDQLNNHSVVIALSKRPPIIIPASVFPTDDASAAFYRRAIECMRNAHGKNFREW
jgi:hypothetical protein